MPQKKCGFGFCCASMMMQPGLEPKNCPNWKTCGKVQEYSPDEVIELQRVRIVQAEREHYQFRITRHEAAIMMLQQRGNSQSLEDFDLPAQQSAIAQSLTELQDNLALLTENYVAPLEVNAHRYNVKRPGRIYRNEEGQFCQERRIYWYNKLTASQPIFEPSEDTPLEEGVEENRPVRAIHLSHDNDPRNMEGRLGLERRNRLMAIHTQLQIAADALAAANAITTAPMDNVLAELHELIARTPDIEVNAVAESEAAESEDAVILNDMDV